MTSQSPMLISLCSALNGRLKAILSVAVIIVASATFGSSVYAQSKSASDSEHLNQQRELYRQSIKLIGKGDWRAVRKQRQQLVDYPLYPYLVYAELLADLRYSKRADIAAYLDTYSGTVKARFLQGKWLDYLARRGHWQTYITTYGMHDYVANSSRQCNFYLAQYRLGNKPRALQGGLQLWAQGKSQPKTCDKLFGILIKGGHISESLAWQRFNEAILSHRYQLARYLKRFFTSPSYSKRYDLYYNVDRDPKRVGNYKNFQERNQDELNILEHGLKHLARKDPNRALKHWSRYQQTHEFSHAARATIISAIVKALYRDGHTSAADSYHVDHLKLLNQTLEGQVTEWRIREALRDLDWPTVRKWLARLPKENQEQTTWRYWTIRSMESDPASTLNPHIETLTRSLAKERDFFGFLASEKLDQDYSINHNPVPIDEERINKLAANPAMQRARELLFHGDGINANREWSSASQNFDRFDWLGAAVLASQWHWHSKAIASLGTVKYWDDVEIRFPLAYEKEINSAAKNTDIPNYVLFALARQESAFNTRATSSAGAMGLIQVMPATAKSTARKYKIPYRNKKQLHDASTNVPIGATYYMSMLERFDNNRILASAAYNAGPHRVNRWLANSKGKLPFDIWMTLIPFKETRSYVTNILMYSVIYSRKLGLVPPMLLQHERETLL